MSDTLSAQLMREMNERLSESEDEPIISREIEVQFVMVPGLRTGSSVVWAYEEQNLYYRNAYSKATRLESCKCYKPKCKARLYIREDGTAFRHTGVEHSRSHGTMYNDFKEMYCFNKMKQTAETVPASVTPFEIYQQVVTE